MAYAISWRVSRPETAPLLDLEGAGSQRGDLSFQQAGTSPASDPLRAGAAAEAVSASGALLLLNHAFDAVYLGQAFVDVLAACNFSKSTVTAVLLKVELSTEHGSTSAVLYDTASQPLPSLAPGQRHDFYIRHDIRQLGPHTLTCTSAYLAPDGERRQLTQTFGFTTLNPLVVRTKQRSVGGAVLLEATLENGTRAGMLLDAVSFLPSPAYAAQRIDGDGDAGASSGDGNGSEGVSQPLPVICEGGATSFVFRLTRAASAAAAAAAGGGSSAAEAAVLGRIDIRWRGGPMGQPARLQTQLISLPSQQQQGAAAGREVSLSLARLPRRVVVGMPFVATLRLESHSEGHVGPLRVSAATDATGLAVPRGSPSKPPPPASPARSPGSAARPAGLEPARSAAAAAAAAAVLLDGIQEVEVSGLAPHVAVEVQLRLLALEAGQQALPGLALSSCRDGRLYATLPPAELFVESTV